MTTGFSQGMGDVRARARSGQIGDFARVSHLNALMTGINKAPQAKQVSTLAVTDPGDDTIVSLVINGVLVSADTGTGLDQDGVGALIRDAIDAEPLARAAVVPTYDATANDLILTAKIPGIAFTVTDQTATSLGAPSTTAAAAAEAIPFGRALLSQGAATAGEPEEAVALVKVTHLVAQVITATVVNGVADDRTVRVYEVRADERILLVDAPFTGSATEATEATNIAAAVNLAAPANTVLAAAATADVTFTAEKVGMEIEVEIVQGTAGDITFAATTGPDETTSLHRALVGLSLYSAADEAATIGSDEGVYAANRGVKFGARGEIWVEQSQAPSVWDPVYVELAAGADSGKFFNTSTATRLQLARSVARWVRNSRLAADAMSVVHIDTGRVP